ncbi:glyoxylase-like metal-dependent hydrolase (beta-lactamase superfamily II) [Salibacterium salarium]|uniref:MBL fold metallo-hydrolase n=1 Tax=Salibacterium salarium TaxID=284579 RepID=UPI0027868239|nr:MBL fold metallo-hydrolase [Salibacterium salarium]MDQ0299607.1 glyoxylase-like metal-dependent hydrolase (beta-lactamase superfamily II) [Salibacterium salarium]
MKWESIPLGPLQTNCYVLYNNEKQAVIFDPGGDAKYLNEWLENRHLNPVGVLLTHAHFDHIGAVEHIRQTYKIEVFLHEKERDWLVDPEKNGAALFLGDSTISAKKEADHHIDQEGEIRVGPFTFHVYETPGHSPGSVSFFHAESGTVFSGDVLFAGGIGRTDLPGGNQDQLLNVIHDKLLELPENTYVACGHGPYTTIENEMDTNPFLNGF